MGTLIIHFENGDEISFSVPEPVKLERDDPLLTVSIMGEDKLVEETTVRVDKALWIKWTDD